MNIADIIILICFIPALIMGLKKGFISQAISIVSLVVGLWASSRFTNIVMEWLSQYISGSEQVHRIVSFAIILVIVFVVLGLVGKLIESIINFVFLGWVNRLLGAVFAMLKTFLILGLIVLAFNSISNTYGFEDPKFLADSVLYGPLKGTAEAVFPYVKNMLTLK